MGSHQNTTTREEVTGIKPYQDLFNQQFNKARGLVGQPLGLQFAPAFSTGLDPIVSGMVSRGIQNIKAGQGASDRALASGLSLAGTGDNSALLSVLQRQGRIANAGAINELNPMALEQQRNFDIARQNILAQQNQAKLSGRSQQAQEQFNLLNAINSMAGTSAGRTQKSRTSKGWGG